MGNLIHGTKALQAQTMAIAGAAQNSTCRRHLCPVHHPLSGHDSTASWGVVLC